MNIVYGFKHKKSKTPQIIRKALLTGSIIVLGYSK